MEHDGASTHRASLQFGPLVRLSNLTPKPPLITSQCNNVEIKSKLNLVNANISNSSEEEPHDSKVAKKTHESIRRETTSITTTTVKRVSKVADDVNTSGSVESPFEQKVKETENYGNKDHIAFVAAKEE
ncbi:hypothetical protein Tco_0488680 [Tanacetum coccineum]